MVPLAKRAAQREAGDSVLALYLAKPPSVAFKSFGSLTSFCVEADMVGRKILQRRGKKDGKQKVREFFGVPAAE